MPSAFSSSGSMSMKLDGGSLPASSYHLNGLRRTCLDTRSVVVMTCGIAGSGKTTLAKAIAGIYPDSTRISIDEITAREHGIYGVDFPAEDHLYEEYQNQAGAIYLEEFRTLLKAGNDIILERSFYAREDRDDFKKMIEQAGARWVLVHLKAMDKEVLWRRIQDRAQKKKTADSAYDITRECFDNYWDGFERPEGEGEVIVEACQKE